MNDLMSEDGVLHPILERVKYDDTIMLAIRTNYINIYYRGGNLLKIKAKNKGSYPSSFDKKYDKYGGTLPGLPAAIKNQDDARTWINAFPHLKEIMDLYFSSNRKRSKNKPEREFQQLVVRENNHSSISKKTGYFVSDIEFADPDIGARFDILAIRWLRSCHKKGGNCRAALMEMKYGDDALEDAPDDNRAGLLKHLRDIDAFISNRKKYKSLLNTMASQFNQLDELGLVKYNRRSNGAKVRLDANDKPEVVLLLANHNPRSKIMLRVLDSSEFREYEENKPFDLRFFVSTFAGYGLHSDCMLTLTQFTDLLKSMRKR